MFRQIGSTFGVAVFSALFIFNFTKAITESTNESLSNPRSIFSSYAENLVNMNIDQIKFVEQSIAFGIEVVFWVSH